MISHEHRFIFVHIAKTGGTSIEHGLEPYGKLLQGPENFESIYYKHAIASDLRRMLGPPEYETYFTFSFVRNPWDWIASNYAFNRGLARPFIIGTDYSISGKVPVWGEAMTFDTWLPWWIEEFSPSQASVLTDEDGRLLVDFVGHFEQLEDDFRRVCARLGLPAAPLPHLKATRNKKPYRQYYDATTEQLVLDHFKLDFELFGYSMDLHAPLPESSLVPLTPPLDDR